MRSKAQRRFNLSISIICLVLGLAWAYKTVSVFCEAKTDGFTVLGVSSHRDPNPAWDVHPLSDAERHELDQALNQKYRYLARGNQAFAFLSEDGRFVLKFFKQKLFQPPFLLKAIPTRLLQEGRSAKKVWKKGYKLQRDFESYRLAFDELKEETGLVLVHLNRSEWIQKRVAIVDKLNIEHQIDLDRFDFIIQKRADLVYPTIDKLMAEGNANRAKEALSSILKMFVSRCQKGIDDSDPDLDKNFGFIDGKAIQIDIGRFTRYPQKVKFHERHLLNLREPQEVKPPLIKDSFKSWLSSNYPALFEHFDSEYRTLCEEGAFSPSKER